MRNLSLVSRSTISTPGPWGVVESTCTDVDENILYGVNSACSGDSSIITVWKQSNTSKNPIAERVTDFPTEGTSGSCKVLSFHVLPETRQLCIVMRGGDISVVSIDDVDPEANIVGSFDSGIRAASWAPDDSYLILVNGNGELLQMTRDFDVLYEAPLSTTDFGEDVQNALGWGSKSTQFHGSLGKAAAVASSVSTMIGASPDDDAEPRISWRGDASYFCVSSLESPGDQAPKRRFIRVYSPSPDLTLHSTMEPTAGLEHPLAWNPSGSLIASTQRYGSKPEGMAAGREGRHDTVFFERNGLRRGGFEIVKGGGPPTRDLGRAYAIHQLAWSCDSNILAVWIRSRANRDSIQLWTTGNYHWYLKQCIWSPLAERYTSMTWHPENALKLTITTRKSVIQHALAWTTCCSLMQTPDDAGTVAVIDGANILITPFRVQNVPPPMCSLKLCLYPHDESRNSELPTAPVDIALASHRGLLAILDVNKTVAIWDLSDSVMPGPRHSPTTPKPKRIWEGGMVPTTSDPTHDCTGSDIAARQIVIWRCGPAVETDWNAAILASDPQTNEDVIHLISNTAIQPTRATVHPGTANGRLFVSTDNLWIQSTSGEIFFVDPDQSTVSPSGRSLSAYCLAVSVVELVPADDGTGVPTITLVGMTSNGKLLVSASQEAHQTSLAENVTSFAVTSSYLTYITTAHEAHFVPTSALRSDSRPQSETRRVERGSRIVVAVPGTMSLVLQMPRGNLETICPRPFVLDVIRSNVKERHYRKAFLACRKHRIDLGVIVDDSFEQFMDGLDTFVNEITEVDHINLFLANIGRSSRPTTEVNQICDKIRIILEQRNLTLYINSILTAHVSKSPPDLEAALGLLARLQAKHQDSVEDAVKYIIFLVDADTLFDTALALYDFPLTLLIAQHSQRDPREYIPFLRTLRALPGPYQKFSIDDHLKRHAKALVGLRDSGPEHFEEAIRYIEKHRLYVDSLGVWKEDQEKCARLQNVYGDHLYERRDFEQAALAFTLGAKWRKALLAYEKSYQWKEAFALASAARLNESEISSLAARMAEDLIGRKRFLEAARILLDYHKDIRGALVALVQGNDVSEALRVATLEGHPELIEEVIHPSILTLREELGDEITEANEQLSKQAARYRELQVKKIQEPQLFYMEDNPALQNIDIMTEAGESVVSTAFTRYTAAPTATSRSSKTRASKVKKQERKKGKKGTVDEEDYIVASFVKMVARLEHLHGECSRILPHLLVMSAEHKNEGLSLQSELRGFDMHLQDVLDEVWPETGGGQIEQRPKKPAASSKLWSSSLLT